MKRRRSEGPGAVVLKRVVSRVAEGALGSLDPLLGLGPLHLLNGRPGLPAER